MNNDNAGRFEETIVGRFARHLHDTEVFTNEFTRDMSNDEFEQFLCDEYDEWTINHPSRRLREIKPRELVKRRVEYAIKACAEVWCPVRRTIRGGRWVRR